MAGKIPNISLLVLKTSGHITLDRTLTLHYHGKVRKFNFNPDVHEKLTL